MTKKCKSCPKDIDIKAQKCPHCKADQRNWFSRHPIVTGILVLFIIFGLIGAVHVGNKNTGLSNQMQSEQNQPTPKTVRHGNSGAGTDTRGNSFIQDHLQHALQHVGL